LYPAAPAPGEIIWARVFHHVNNPADLGRIRPAILIEPEGSFWQAVSLTSNPRYRDGNPRLAVPDARAVGLRSPGWLWSRNLGLVSDLDIQEHIGWVDHGLAEAVIDLVGLEGASAHGLLCAADRHHRRPDALGRSLLDGGAA